MWLSITVRMLSVNTEISKPLEKLLNTGKSFYISIKIVFTAKFIVSLQNEDVTAFIINMGNVYYCRYNLYTSCTSSLCIAQSICTAETKLLYKCVNI